MLYRRPSWFPKPALRWGANHCASPSLVFLVWEIETVILPGKSLVRLEGDTHVLSQAHTWHYQVRCNSGLKRIGISEICHYLALVF